MAAKKVKGGNSSATMNGKVEGAEETSKRKNNPTSSSLPALSVPGIILAIGAAYIYHARGKISENVSFSSNVWEAPSSRKLITPPPGSWTDGFYTTEPVAHQKGPSTHALLYQNGGIGEPELVSFSNDEEFLSLGRLYNDLGQIVQSPSHFINGTALYRGPAKAGTHFQWPAVHVGYKRPVPGLVGGNGKQIELETLTEPSSSSATSDPRVFYVHNFLSDEEADEFIRFSTAEENPYKMAHSTGGTHKAWNQGGENARLATRTSMNAFDITTELSFRIKQRAFRLLRMGAYKENLADGIQILRYELGQAYVAHHDYFPSRQSEDHSWDPLYGGSNRFATVFLYLSDVEVGGQTVFPNSKRLTADKSEDLVARLGEAPSTDFLKALQKEAGLRDGSWEENLISKCYHQFAVPPRRGDAILFYSQRPDGELDINSLHGACPVLKGMKWGANLWVWNACRYSLCEEDPLQPAKELPDELTAPYPGGK
eukprot:CCRYP_013830-RA/>CCRYP_013830-RA protein AED:0.44 eAED:0.44 QI:0/0/0/1/1/1/3/0/483